MISEISSSDGRRRCGVCREKVDAGVHLGGRLSHAPRDLERTLGGRTGRRERAQHLDLGEACERPCELRRLCAALERRDGGLGRLERFRPVAAEPRSTRAQSERIRTKPRVAKLVRDRRDLGQPYERTLVVRGVDVDLRSGHERA